MGVPADHARHTSITQPGDLGDLFNGLPSDISRLCSIVRGLLFHYREGPMYGHRVPHRRVLRDEARSVRGMLTRIVELDVRPLKHARPNDRRLVGCCRDYAVLLTAILRQQGVPARARFGFSRYFVPDFAFDHVVAEAWCESRRRWVLIDAQQDAAHIALNRLTFDPADVPREQFLVAGAAWKAARSGQIDPDTIGYSRQECGWWALAHYVLSDVASLCDRELLIGDGWGLGEWREPRTDAEWTLLDRAAELSAAPEVTMSALRALYEGNAVLRIPAVVAVRSIAHPHRVRHERPE